ncbi:hypothetical protein EDD16DRAFT_1485386, partial [Pisolithus croceorrhizus]
PLRMVLHGEGGTGKSKVTRAITEYFTSRSARHLLLKATHTGVTASLIPGLEASVISVEPVSKSYGIQYTRTRAVDSRTECDGCSIL